MKLTQITNPVALRRDTTVGTRIFAGTTMIHGDTGRRDMSNLSSSLDLSTSNVHGMYIRRVGNTVTFTARGIWVSGQWITENLPAGFRPLSGEYSRTLGFAEVGGNVRAFGNPATFTRLSFVTPYPVSGADVSINGTWLTDEPWPSTLPGLPA